MFKTAKSKLVTQLICSALTILPGLFFLSAIMSAFFGENIPFFYNIVTGIDNILYSIDAPVSTVQTYMYIGLAVALVVHIACFIISGGAGYGFRLYVAVVKGAFWIPIPILNIILTAVAAVIGIFVVLGLAPIFAFYSAIKNYIESESLVY